MFFLSPILFAMLLNAFFQRHRDPLGLLAALAIITGALEAAFIFLLKRAFLSTATQNYMLVGLFILCVLASLRTGVQILSAKWETKIVFEFITCERNLLIENTVTRTLPLARKAWRFSLFEMLENGLDGLGTGIAAGLRCLAALIQGLVLVPLLFLFSWKLAFAALVLAGPAILVSRFRAHLLSAKSRDWESSKNLMSEKVEGFSESVESHLGNGRMRQSAQVLERDLCVHAMETRGWEWSKAIFPPALEWFFFMVLAVLAALGTHYGWVQNQGVGALGLIPFGTLLLLLYRPIREWARHYPIFLHGNQIWKNVRNLNVTVETFPVRVSPPLSPNDKINIQNLSFAYEEEGKTNWVFENFDYELSPSVVTWIKGPNGSGKSTLLKLLAGIEYAHLGTIALPKIDIGYLSQQGILESDWLTWFNEFSVKNENTWKRLDEILGVSSILDRLKRSEFDSRSKSTEMYFKPMESGILKGLSGGERQRLALARIFASSVSYLLLDEPTTWLSGDSREKIMQGLLEFWTGRGRGAAVVSHEKFVGEFCSHTLSLSLPQRKILISQFQ